jgi:hypothetical protein
MPIGQPDSVETLADRLVREAMEKGEFEDLTGTGEPIPGTGTHDDDAWWIRSWVERNRPTDAQTSRKSS